MRSTLVNRGTYVIKKCTLEGAEIIKEFKGDFRDAKSEANRLQEEFCKEKLGKDWQNEKKRKKLGVQFTATIKI